MKNTLTVFIITLFTFIAPTNSSAQTLFGLRGGLNIAGINDLGERGDVDVKAGYYLGVMAERKIKDRFLIRPELVYSGKGYIFLKRYWDGTKFVISDNGYLHLNYISLPVLGGFRPNDDITLYAGPEFSYMIRGKATFGKKDYAIKNYEKFDIGLALGVSYRLSKKIAAEMRYTKGFATLTTVRYYDMFGNVTKTEKRGTNKVLQLGVSYELGKGEKGKGKRE